MHKQAQAQALANAQASWGTVNICAQASAQVAAVSVFLFFAQQMLERNNI